MGRKNTREKMSRKNARGKMRSKNARGKPGIKTEFLLRSIGPTIDGLIEEKASLESSDSLIANQWML